MKGNSAIIVVDLVHDFVDGKFGSEEAKSVVKRTRDLLSKRRELPLIVTRDYHMPNDPEFAIWGEHCLQGTVGSELVPEIAEFESHVITKRHYDAFYDSDLDGYLSAIGANDIYICGISTDICVRHTVAGAFFRNYSISVIEDLCAAIDPNHHAAAIKEMKSLYGVKLVKSGELKQ